MSDEKEKKHETPKIKVAKPADVVEHELVSAVVNLKDQALTYSLNGKIHHAPLDEDLAASVVSHVEAHQAKLVKEAEARKAAPATAEPTS